MIGANPKLQVRDGVGPVISPATPTASALPVALAVAALFVPLPFVLAQCGRAPNAGMLAANTQRQFRRHVRGSLPGAAIQGSLSDRAGKFCAAAGRSRGAHRCTAAAAARAPSPRRSASPRLRRRSTLPRPTERDELTTLVGMKSSAFPYFGNNPRSDSPFLNVTKGDRKGHRAINGRVYWQDETYNDNRVLVHVPETIRRRKPGVIVVFFHGNGATLERDVRDRQLVPQQISDSGVNAVLLAPQLAVDAADSSAGKFWQPGGFKRFMDELVSHLARLSGDPKSAQAFANMPIVIVGYSGGFLPTAWSLEVGGVTNRVRGVFLLDAVYGELDKFASWIENNRSGFFVSSYTRYTKRHDQELMSMLREKGITVTEHMDGPLRPGSVVFVQTADGITHRDYVTQAWTENPIKEVLVKMAATPVADEDGRRALTREPLVRAPSFHLF